MEKELCLDDKSIDSSFDEEINEINDEFQNNSPKNFNCNFETKNEEEKTLKDVDNKCFEEADINEIYDLLNVINKAVTIDISKKNRKDYYNKNKKLLNIVENINPINDSHSKVSQEILSILQKPLCYKIIRNKDKHENPFKPLSRPKKISLVGKIFFGSPSNDFNIDYSTKDNKF